MNIVYYTSGTTGSGRLVRGLSIWNALERSEQRVDYTIVSSSPLAFLVDGFNIKHIEIPVESEDILISGDPEDSILYQTLVRLKPDILLVDLMWFSLFNIMDKLSCKKIFLSRQVSDSFFSIPLKNKLLKFTPGQYDRIIAIEPFDSCIDMEQVNPIILRNRDEIMSKEIALKNLGLSDKKPVCLMAYNGHPGDFRNVQKTYSYLEDEGYQIIYSTNYEGGIFPVVDYFNAFDLLVCGGGYNAFWEAKFFEKEAIIVPTHARFEDPQVRINKGQDFKFKQNGADQLAGIIMEL